ncbi:hypothetical protein R1flu_007480 [Riccia fluitans]|uniref:Uncharacterized protein n=1 Tax=Riccia fluitans TaxID=41844 RepID=A0ABD1YYZ9_9MARC
MLLWAEALQGDRMQLSRMWPGHGVRLGPHRCSQAVGCGRYRPRDVAGIRHAMRPDVPCGHTHGIHGRWRMR